MQYSRRSSAVEAACARARVHEQTLQADPESSSLIQSAGTGCDGHLWTCCESPASAFSRLPAAYFPTVRCQLISTSRARLRLTAPHTDTNSGCSSEDPPSHSNSWGEICHTRAHTRAQLQMEAGTFLASPHFMFKQELQACFCSWNLS